jgi:tRNA(Ile)-lysidine synthase
MADGDALLLGHHLDDQAETFMLRLMRGAGADGLAAMAAKRDFQSGHLLRPLLGFSQAQLNDYALQAGLSWVEDPSNQDDRFDRNLIRNQIMPQLQTRWPAANTTLARSAQLVSEASELNQMLAAEDAQQVAYRPEKLGFSCDAVALAKWPPLRTGNVLRHLLAQFGLPKPSQAVMAQLCTQIFGDQWHREQRSRVSWGPVECVRYGHRAYVLPRLPDASTEAPLIWDGRQPLVLPDGSQLQLIRGGHLRWDGAPVTVHFGTAGWRSKPQGRKHSQQLKKVLQERELPPWWRQRLPLVVADDGLAAVADLWVESDRYVSDSAQGYRVDWRYS